MRRAPALIWASACIACIAAPSAAPAKPRDFKTKQPPQLVSTARHVEVDPILTTGDVIGGYQMSGIPDGLGAFSPREETLDVFMNHELNGTPSDSRVSRVRLTGKHRVTRARYVLDGSEGYKRLCSSSLSYIGGVPTYFTGEEASPGRSIAVNALDESIHGTDHFGFFDHENNVALPGLPFGLFINSEDGPADHSQLYAYSAPTLKDAVEGRGRLLVWKADGLADSSNDIGKGQTLAGRFVPLSEADNADAAALEAAAQREGAFDFTRAEDVAQSKRDPAVAYLADTGDGASESRRGRLYQIRIDPGSDPTSPRASLSLLVDGDAGDDLVNPDNIDTSRRAVLITEDRNSENRGAEVAGGYGRVLVYDIATGALRPVARVNTPASLSPGTWESSGVLNAARFFGRDWWLIDVQAHGVSRPQPGPTLAPNSSSGEDGQLLAIRVPGSAP
jgi:hypothetical protein